MNLFQRLQFMEKQLAELMKLNQELPQKERAKQGFHIIYELQRGIEWAIQDVRRLF